MFCLSKLPSNLRCTWPVLASSNSTSVKTLRTLVPSREYATENPPTPGWTDTGATGGSPGKRRDRESTSQNIRLELSVDINRWPSGESAIARRVWDTASGALLQTLKGHLNDVNSVTFTLDGARVLSASGEIIDHTQAGCPSNVRTRLPVALSQSLTVASLLAERTHLPSGENTTDLIVPL